MPLCHITRIKINMSQKTRILIANDSSTLATGYGVYGKELLTRLSQTDKYEIAELACYVGQDDIDKGNILNAWKTYGNAPSKDAEKSEMEAYSSSTINAFGAAKFHQVCVDFKPDIVFDMRDYWMYSYQETSPFRPFFKWVVMPTVDSAPQKREWLWTFSNMDLVVPYTEWARETLRKQCGDTINLFPEVVNAGVDLETFVPLENKKETQKRLFGKEVEITGCVMRNQKRKLIPDILKAYRLYLNRLLEEGKTEQHDKSCLYLHTTYPETSGWDLQSLLLEHRLLDKTYFTSKCKGCGSVSITKFHCNLAKCSSCKQNGIAIVSVQNGVDAKDLASIYQTFDLFLQIAICEGFGMPQVEAAACGVPIASTNYSAMKEIVRKLEGYPVPLSSLFREMETGADRANIDVVALTGIIYDHFAMSEEQKLQKSKRTRELCEQNYSWDLTAKVWDKALSSVDISTNAKWDDPVRPSDISLSVPAGLSPVEVVEWIIVNIIKEPWLMKTANVKKLLVDTILGYTSQNGRVVHIDTKSAIKLLESIMRSKVAAERMRTGTKND